MYKMLYINIDYLEMNQGMYKLLNKNIDYLEMNQGMYMLLYMMEVYQTKYHLQYRLRRMILPWYDQFYKQTLQYLQL